MGHPQSPLTVRQQRNAVECIQAGSLIEMLQKHALLGNRSKLSATRIRAAEVLLARAVPTLSAVDQTLHSPDDVLTEDQLMDKLQALISAHPDLLQKLLAMQARGNPGPQDVVSGGHVHAQQSDQEDPIIP